MACVSLVSGVIISERFELIFEQSAEAYFLLDETSIIAKKTLLNSAL